MRKLIQTHPSPHGNCWQTAVACILNVPAEALPPQHEIEAGAAESRETEDESKWFAGQFSFQNALQAYLWKHHGLGYTQLPAWQLAACDVRGQHVLVGTTVRTVDKPGETRILHAVVGYAGELLWDPHPSQAGLIEVTALGFLLPPPVDYRPHPARVEHELRNWRADASKAVSTLCCCPLCFANGEYL